MLHRTFKAAAAATCALFLLGCGGGSAVEMESAALDATGLLKPLAVAASDLQDWEASDTQAVDASGLQQVALGQGAQSSQSTGSAGSGTAPSQPAQPQPPVSPSSPQDAGKQDTHAVEIGMNLPELSYWDESYAMADVVRHSRLTNATAKDTNGAPMSDFNLFFNSRRIGAGTYKLIFTGRADLRIDARPSGRIENQKYDAVKNRTTADVVLPDDADGNTWIAFKNTRRATSSTTADGVTQVQMWRPGYSTDGSVTFTKEFLGAMRKVSVLRAMDMTATNRNPQQKWSDRTPPSFIGMTEERGQSWELLIALANAAGRDLWINVPVKADDDYIRKLAQLFRYGSDGEQPYTKVQSNPVYPPLRSDLKLYVEYGNEIWNTSRGFWGYRWAGELAAAAVEVPNHPINNDGTKSNQLSRWTAYRAATISETFRSIWGDAAMMTQVRPMFATQAGNANSFLRNGMMWAESYYGNVSRLWWGGGGASYYGHVITSGELDEKTMLPYFVANPSDAEEMKVRKRIQVDTVWLRGYGLRNVAYEGGPQPGGSELGGSTSPADISNTYNNDPRMANVMAAAYDEWKSNGGGLFVYYGYSGMGNPWWFIDGTKKHTKSDTASVKMRFLESLNGRPVVEVTLGRQVPTNIYAGDSDIFVENMNSSIDGSGDDMRFRLRYVNTYNGVTTYPKAMLLVPLRAEKASSYSLKLVVRDSGAATKAKIWVNGQVAGVIEPGVVVNSKTGPLTTSGLPIALPKGLSVLRIQNVAGEELNIRNIVVE